LRGGREADAPPEGDLGLLQYLRRGPGFAVPDDGRLAGRVVAAPEDRPQRPDRRLRLVRVRRGERVDQGDDDRRVRSHALPRPSSVHRSAIAAQHDTAARAVGAGPGGSPASAYAAASAAWSSWSLRRPDTYHHGSLATATVDAATHLAARAARLQQLAPAAGRPPPGT